MPPPRYAKRYEMEQDGWDMVIPVSETEQDLEEMYGTLQELVVRLKRLTAAVRTTTYRDFYPGLQIELQQAAMLSSCLERDMAELLRSL